MSFLTEYYDEYRNLPLRKTVMCRPENRWAKLEGKWFDPKESVSNKQWTEKEKTDFIKATMMSLRGTSTYQFDYCAHLSPGLALADRAGLNQADLLDVLALTPLASPHLILKGRGKYIRDDRVSTHQPLTHMQKDLKLALGLGDTLEQSLPLTATTNEIFKHAKRLGYANHDVAAVYIRARF